MGNVSSKAADEPDLVSDQVRNVSSEAADKPHLISDQVGNVSSKAADEPHLVSDQVRNVSSISPNTIKFQHPPAIIPYLIPITSSPKNPARRRGGVHGA